jgi:low temperature requirement protein LtrA
VTPARCNTSPGPAGTPGGEDTRNPGLELFFDLVFVLCVAQLADKLHAHPTWTATAGVIFLFVPVWWAWTGMTFAINRFPGDNVTVTVLVLAAAAASGLMALAIPHTPGPDNDWFAAGYLAVRLILVTSYLRARGPDERLTRFYAAVFAATATAWFSSVFAPRTVQPYIWAAALVCDILVPALADHQHRILPVDERHLPERFGSFAIIVLGESAVNTANVTTRPFAPAVALLVAEGGSSCPSCCGGASSTAARGGFATRPCPTVKTAGGSPT